jgi:glycolate oxidase
MRNRSRYGKLTKTLISRLSGIVGEKNILISEGKEDYSRDEEPHTKPFPPEVVVKPVDAASVANTLLLANAYEIPVTPRGAGTGLSGGSVPIHGGIVLSTERLNKILEIDEENFCAFTIPFIPERKALLSVGMFQQTPADCGRSNTA